MSSLHESCSMFKPCPLDSIFYWLKKMEIWSYQIWTVQWMGQWVQLSLMLSSKILRLLWGHILLCLSKISWLFLWSQTWQKHFFSYFQNLDARLWINGLFFFSYPQEWPHQCLKRQPFWFFLLRELSWTTSFSVTEDDITPMTAFSSPAQSSAPRFYHL